jgi:hypothetical protein
VHAMCRARRRKITAHTSKPWSVVAKRLSKTANLSAVLVRATMPGVIFTPRATLSRPQISTKRSESAPARAFLAEARVSPHALPIAETPAQHFEQADRPRSRMFWPACSEGSPRAARNASRAAARYVHSTSPCRGSWLNDVVPGELESSMFETLLTGMSSTGALFARAVSSTCKPCETTSSLRVANLPGISESGHAHDLANNHPGTELSEPESYTEPSSEC